MKEGQVHQIDDFAAGELQRTLVAISDAGSAIRGITSALTEIGTARNCEDELIFLNNHEEGNLWHALTIIGKYLNDKTYKQARRFGLKEPC